MAKPLTATMAEALAEILDHGGEIIRYQGGFWSWRGVARQPHNGQPVEYFGTSTINGLEARGKLIFTEWREGRNGRFPIVANIPPFGVYVPSPKRSEKP